MVAAVVVWGRRGLLMTKVLCRLSPGCVRASSAAGEVARRARATWLGVVLREVASGSASTASGGGGKTVEARIRLFPSSLHPSPPPRA